VANEEFNFEAEFALLDIGATSSMLRAGSVRPTVLAFTSSAGVEAIALDWTEESGGPARAFEEARRFIRDLQPVAYALIAHLTRNGRSITYHLPDETVGPPNEFLTLAMFAEDGNARGVMYPVRRTLGTVSFGMPAVTDGEMTDWCPLGDLWGNPYCTGDTVRFLPRERAVEPGTPLWQTVVELTRLRIHEDQANADEYMAFLDDLRNGVFVVAGRPADDLDRVLLRPRTVFNPLGTLNVEASRLTLADRAPADVEKVAAL
jgi:hypothetical protein